MEPAGEQLVGCGRLAWRRVAAHRFHVTVEPAEGSGAPVRCVHGLRISSRGSCSIMSEAELRELLVLSPEL